MILTTNKLSAASVNNHPEFDPNTFSLLLVDENKQQYLIQKPNRRPHRKIICSNHYEKYRI